MPQVYAAAQRWVDRCLRQDGSLFVDGAEIWSPPVLGELHRLFADHPDMSKDPFEVKLARQLDGASDPAIQLAGELLFIHFLPAARVGGPRKRELINRVLGWMSSPVPLDADNSPALDEGVMYMGVAFNTGRNFGFGFLLDFAIAWKRLSDEERNDLLEDPWAFKKFLWGLPIFSAYAQREGVLHLVHPDTFESIAYGQHKLDISAAFADRVPEPTNDVDRKLSAIRQSLEVEAGRQIDFYQEGIVERWQHEKAGAASQEPEAQLPVVRRAWLIRGTTSAGDSLVPQWINEAFVSIGWHEIGPVAPGTTRGQIRDRSRNGLRMIRRRGEAKAPG